MGEEIDPLGPNMPERSCTLECVATKHEDLSKSATQMLSFSISAVI